MRKKADHIRRDHYAARAATIQAARLLVGVERNQPGPTSIRVEAAEQGAWDDIVVVFGEEGRDEQQWNWQVKRQATPLSPDAMEKLFSGMKGLRTAALDAEAAPPDRFVFALRDLVSLVRKKSEPELRLSVLQDLCETLRQPAVDISSVVAGLQRQEREWLAFVQTSLGNAAADDYAEALETLRTLEVKTLGSDAKLDEEARDLLALVFEDAEAVRDRLYNFIRDNTDPRTKITYGVLREQLLADVKRCTPGWVRFERKGPFDRWKLSSPVGKSNIASVLWRPTRTGTTITIDAVPKASLDEAEITIIRLLTHLSERVEASVNDPERWHAGMQETIGGTLGVEASHRPRLAPHDPAQGTCSASMVMDPEELVEELARQMAESFDETLSDAMDRCFADPASEVGIEVADSLARKISLEWVEWRNALDNDRTLRSDFLQGLAATAGEMRRSALVPGTRVGPKTVATMARGVFIGLAVAVALKEGGTNATPSNHVKGANIRLGDGNDCCHLVATKFVSDQAGKHGSTFDSAAADFAQEEPGLTLLANVNVPARHLVELAAGRDIPYSYDAEDLEAFQSDYSRTPFVTSEAALKRALAEGVDAVRTYLANLFKNLVDGELASIRASISLSQEAEEPGG